MPVASQPFRILLAGLGNRGRMWASIIEERADVTLSGVVDVDPSALDAFAARHPGLPAFPDLGAALQATTSDAVLLVTPPYDRLPQAAQVFAAGLPLLAEKPLSVGLNFRYLPVSRKLRELVIAQAFGAPGFAQFTYLRNRDGRRPGLNKYPLTMQHPMMLEQSIHHLDLMRFCYAREVEQVLCRTWNPAWSMYAHDSNVSCLLTFTGGLEVSYLGTWTGGWDELQFQWRTDCSRGVIVQRELFADLATAAVTDPELAPVALPAARPFYDDSAALLADFVSHVRAGTPLACSGADHLYTLALCFAAIESDRTGCAVAMDEFYRRHGIPEPA